MIPLILTGILSGIITLLIYQKIAYPFLWADLIYYLKLRLFKKKLQARMKQGILTYLDCFLHQSSKTPNKPFIIFQNRSLTYGDVDRRSSRFAYVFRDQKSLGQGDIVALLMCNEPDFISVWLGLCKVGCEVAFLNNNIKAKSLLHCLHCCGARTLVVGAELAPLVEEVRSELLKEDVTVLLVDHSCVEGFGSLLDEVEVAPSENFGSPPKVDIMSNFVFIFTSGTTGLPKAARVGHLKAIASMAFLHMCGATSDDVIYISLPLYHMSASLLGIGGCIFLDEYHRKHYFKRLNSSHVNMVHFADTHIILRCVGKRHSGATCVLKNKFSASQFWKDCVKHNVTVMQYIGELCRYLVNQPTVPEERMHSVWLAAGSGLRSDVWKEFVRRFGCKIREGYGLTEASVGFLNYTDEIGPIGRAGYFNKLSMSFELLKYDPQTYEPVRAQSGRCIRTHRGEAGILVAPLSAMNQFLGYAGNREQSEKKLVRDVFKSGDVYFNTGDLLLHDHRDFLYFRDRVGDTFRWKGENVSTMEVSEILLQLDCIQEANVYGVSVPGYEGRAGMAAIVLKPNHELNGSDLHRHLVESLPRYAWPRFLRIQSRLDVTETFKQQKQRLVQEGFNTESVADPLFSLDHLQGGYTPLTASLCQDILLGKVKL